MTSGGRTSNNDLPEFVFPRGYWLKRFRSFVNLSNLDPDWKNIKLTPPPTDPGEIRRETEELLRKQGSEEREERLEEIEYEAHNLTPKFHRILVMNDVSHPHTAEVIDAAIIAGRLAHFHFKNIFNRARPSQIEPKISPPIDIPGHPAFPSGHGNQLYLIAQALSEFVPIHRARFFEIAHRVAENREYAGVHYASDTRAGIELAEAFYPYFREAYHEEFELARAEWPTP